MKNKFLKINIADIEARLEANSPEFIKEAEIKLSPFLSHKNNPPHFNIKLYANNNWSYPKKVKICRGRYIITDSDIVIKDWVLKNHACFNFSSQSGEIIINNHWQNGLVPFLLRIYVYYLLKNNGVFLHASCAVRNGISHIFLGNSGFGKTTVARTLIRKGYTILHDDLTCIRRIKNEYKVFAHPFDQTGNSIYLNDRRSYRVNRIYILKKSEKSHIEKISHSEALLHMIRNIYLLGKRNILSGRSFSTMCELLQSADTFGFNFSYYDKKWSKIF